MKHNSVVMARDTHELGSPTPLIEPSTIAAVTGLITASIAVGTLIWKPYSAWRRSRQLQTAMDVHFLVPMISQTRTIEYASQDEREHHCDEIVLPSNSRTLVELWMRPRIQFTSTHLTVGAMHDDADPTARDTKPRPLRLRDVYGQGMIEQDCEPGKTSGHVINSRRQYRWNREIKWNGRSTVVFGVEVQTFIPGRYIWQVYVAGDELDKSFDLKIVVDEAPVGVTLNCVNRDHGPHTLTAFPKRRVERSTFFPSRHR